MSGKRPAKGKVHIAPPGDFIALGKGKSPADSDLPRLQSSSKKPEKKREGAPGISGAPPVKKPKILSHGQTFTPLGRTDTDRRSSPAPSSVSQYDELAVEVDGVELLEEILEAEDMCNDERLEALICGAVKQLKQLRSKPETAMYLTLMHLAKEKPSLFNNEVVIEAMCSTLKRDVSLNFKSKGNPLVSVCMCSILLAAFIEEENWPDEFVKVFIDDSLGDRVWIDRSDCKGFVDNVITAFNTNLPPKSLLQSEPSQGGSASPVVVEDEDGNVKMESADNLFGDLDINVFPRYPFQQDSIETFVIDLIKEQINRRQGTDSTARNLIRLMTSTCGYGEVRLLSAQKLEMWLQNPKLTRSAQDLLMSVCLNCGQNDPNDTEVLSLLIKMRMKTKPLLNHFLACLKEVLSQHPENLRMIMTHTIYNELSNSRNPNNMALITVLFQNSQDQAARILAEIFQDLLANKDDYLRAVRALLREIARNLRHDVHFSAFCLGLMQERNEPKFSDMEPAFKERYASSVADIVALTVFLGITPTIRETAVPSVKSEKKDLDALHTFRDQISVIQRDAVWWLHTVLPKFMEIKPAEYVHCLHKVLFLENVEQYHNKDNWPPDVDRTLFMRLAAEVPVLEDTLMRVLVIGLSPDLPLGPAESVDLADQLIKRAAYLSLDGQVVLQMERLELIDALLNLCSYSHPVDITLPKGYKPPTLAISNLYWKSWVILLVLSAFNPRTFGLTSWENYPTLKCMMEMVMTKNYVFPPPTTVVEDKTVSDIVDQERQIGEQEKQQILEFESHLAAASSKVTITEANSLLIAQLTSMDPNGTARKPPTSVLEQIKTINDTLHIGQRLCRSRQPDFLLDIIQRQGTSKSMPWLAELVDGNEGSLQVLPVQCLCEFLLQDSESAMFDQDDESSHVEKHKRRQKMKKKEQLLKHLQNLVHGDSDQEETAGQVLDYFLKRLSSQQPSNRLLAIKGLWMVLSQKPMEEMIDIDYTNQSKHSWLLTDLPQIPVFTQVKEQICVAIRQACQIETDPSLISSYIIFLSTQSQDQTLHQLDDVVVDMAQLIVERNTIINHILPEEGRDNSAETHQTLKSLISLYNNYLKKATEPQKEGYSWSNTQDQILLQWKEGDSATMHILVVHAMIILLTYGPPNCDSQYKELLDTWFPEGGSPPSAFLLDTSEEALLLPDWLKLRMIRSHVLQLVYVALQDIEPGQLLLFIQSFGIPVESMTSLLACLDKAVTLDPGLLEESVEDKQYMAQLIEIQHMRGAKGGELFYNLLRQGDLATNLASKDVEMKDKTVKQSGWWQKSHLHKTTAAWDKEQIQTLLFKVYCTTGKSSSDDHRNYQTLLTTISRASNISIVQNIVSGILELTIGAEREKFIKGILTNPKSCPLFKILISHNAILGQHLNILMKDLFEASKTLKTSVLTPILIKYQDAKLSSDQDQPQQTTLGTVDSILQDISTKAEEGKQTVESLVKKCMRDLIKSGDNTKASEVACTSILHRENTQLTKGMSTLLVDWLELLDPEIVQLVPELQQQLLFAQQQTTSEITSPSGQSQVTSPDSRSFLLALLTHQTSWSSLHQCIHTVLKPDLINSYNPTAVLDFLWACLQIPKIWRGREQKLPKNHTLEDVLALMPQHVISVVEFIVQEVGMVTGKSVDGSTSEDKIRHRSKLLMSCIGENDKSMKCVIKHLVTAIHDNRYKSIYEHVLMELYSQCPKILFLMADSAVCLTDIKTSHTFVTQVDLVSHRLLTGLGEGGHGRRAEERMSDATLALKKLAAQHPVLLLRQLPLIAALLKGKTEFKFGEMRHKNYVTMFTHVQALLENLQPHVFSKDLIALEDIIGSYFSLIENHGDQKVLMPIIAKFIRFLNKFVTSQPQKSVVMLQKQVKLLSDVSALYPDMAGLKSLLAGLCLPTQDKGGDSPVLSVSPIPVLPQRPTSPYTASQLAPFVKKFKGTSQDVLEVLKELDEFSKRKVDILENFMVYLKVKVYDSNDQIRNTAFNLIMRHVRQNPSTAIQYVGLYLQCLNSNNPDVVTSALKILAEFCVLCQDQSNLILQKAFMVGTTTSLDTGSYITETLQLLNLDPMSN
ncbi:integrator complex subunit 1 [Mytilus galloprovincialis]|uniref:Integrator complex subunit 1 n=1 Tax=Mytilus galloprovincialis TaxID=29158 RepID=A0A8B6H5G5_MYTGA|nr:integrator complex subunit 1 [Mytilus galloprovincialis]